MTWRDNSVIRALVFLAENVGSVSRTHMLLINICYSDSKDWMLSLNSNGTHMVHIHTCLKTTHTHETDYVTFKI